MATFGSGFISSAQITDDAITNVKMADDAIKNAEVASDAAIAFSKLAALTSGNLLVGSAANVPTSVASSGDVTIVASGAMTIGADKVTTAMIAQGTSAQVLMSTAAPETAWQSLSGDVTIGATGVTAIGASKVTEAMHLFTDVTTGNSSASAHGFLPKLTGVVTDILAGNGTWKSDRGIVGTGNAGSTTSGTEVEICQASLTNVTAGTDFLLIRILCTGAGGSGPVVLKLRITDGTGTSDTTLSGATVNTDLNSYDVLVYQSPAVNTELLLSYSGVTNATAVQGQTRTTGFDINWLGNSNVFTISLRGNINSGTQYAAFEVLALSRGSV